MSSYSSEVPVRDVVSYLSDEVPPLSFPAGAIAFACAAFIYTFGEQSQFLGWGPQWWRHHGSDFGFPGSVGFAWSVVHRYQPARALTIGYATFLFAEFFLSGTPLVPGGYRFRFDWVDVLAASTSTLLIAMLIWFEERNARN